MKAELWLPFAVQISPDMSESVLGVFGLSVPLAFLHLYSPDDSPSRIDGLDLPILRS